MDIRAKPEQRAARGVADVPQYEYQRLTLPRGVTRSVAQRVLTDAAEYGHWELDRLRLFPDGTRKVTLRRRILRVKSTLSG
jgi:hypothetical protein